MNNFLINKKNKNMSEVENQPQKDADNFCIPSLPAFSSASKPPAESHTPKTSESKPVLTDKPAPLPPPPLHYQKPEWSSLPPVCLGPNELDSEGYCDHYYLEVLKNGSVVQKIELDKEFLSFGRLDRCDVLCEHPSLSRYHAILQYSNGDTDPNNFKEGFYVYDLNSTHGTFVNKTRIKPNDYVKLELDNMFKFGMSTRLYILHGPKPKNYSEDLNINLSHEQMKKVREKYSKLALKLKMQKELQEEEELEKSCDKNAEGKLHMIHIFLF
jgi:hypothetical protein